jgi:hypothetical protein
VLAVNGLVELLGNAHATFEYRYPRPASEYPAPLLNPVFHALLELDEAVDKAVGASVAHGGLPGAPAGSWTLLPSGQTFRAGNLT